MDSQVQSCDLFKVILECGIWIIDLLNGATLVSAHFAPPIAEFPAEKFSSGGWGWGLNGCHFHQKFKIFLRRLFKFWLGLFASTFKNKTKKRRNSGRTDASEATLVSRRIHWHSVLISSYAKEQQRFSLSESDKALSANGPVTMTTNSLTNCVINSQRSLLLRAPIFQKNISISFEKFVCFFLKLTESAKQILAKGGGHSRTTPAPPGGEEWT